MTSQPAVPESARDPGLQPERTALAWARTSLALLVNGSLVVRAGVVHQHRLICVLGALLLAVAAAAFIVSKVRHRRLAGGVHPSAPSMWPIVAISACGLTASAIGVAVIVLGGTLARH